LGTEPHRAYWAPWRNDEAYLIALLPMCTVDAARFAVGLAVPGCTHTAYTEPDSTPAAWWYSLTDHSWATWLPRQP
jgi:hypothetical protein